MDEIKKEISLKVPLRYIMDREKHEPLVVPDRQMSSFIAVAGAYDEQVVYLDSQVVSLREGDRVRITGGVFAGVEGGVPAGQGRPAGSSFDRGGYGRGYGICSPLR